MITAELYPVEVGKVALLKSSNKLVFVLSEHHNGSNEHGQMMKISFDHKSGIRHDIVYLQELETPEARMIEEARFQKFVFDLTAQVNEKAKKGPELVQ